MRHNCTIYPKSQKSKIVLPVLPVLPVIPVGGQLTFTRQLRMTAFESIFTLNTSLLLHAKFTLSVCVVCQDYRYRVLAIGKISTERITAYLYLYRTGSSLYGQRYSGGRYPVTVEISSDIMGELNGGHCPINLQLHESTLAS